MHACGTSVIIQMSGGKGCCVEMCTSSLNETEYHAMLIRMHSVGVLHQPMTACFSPSSPSTKRVFPHLNACSNGKQKYSLPPRSSGGLPLSISLFTCKHPCLSQVQLYEGARIWSIDSSHPIDNTQAEPLGLRQDTINKKKLKQKLKRGIYHQLVLFTALTTKTAWVSKENCNRKPKRHA